MKTDEYMKVLAGYTRSIFHDFEIYLAAKVDLVEHDIRLVLDDYSSFFVTYEL